MNKKVSKWWYLAALFMFVAATFYIVGDHFILGAIFFACAACFLFTAGKYKKWSQRKPARKKTARNQLSNKKLRLIPAINADQSGKQKNLLLPLLRCTVCFGRIEYAG